MQAGEEFKKRNYYYRKLLIWQRCQREEMLVSPSEIGRGGELVELEKYFTYFSVIKPKRSGEKKKKEKEKLALACSSVKRDEDCLKSLCLQL